MRAQHAVVMGAVGLALVAAGDNDTTTGSRSIRGGGGCRMSQLRGRSTSASRPLPDEVDLSGGDGRLPMMLRTVGAHRDPCRRRGPPSAVPRRLQLGLGDRPALRAQLRRSDGYRDRLARPGGGRSAAAASPARTRRDRTFGDRVRLPVHQRAAAALRAFQEHGYRAAIVKARARSRGSRRRHAGRIPRHAQRRSASNGLTRYWARVGAVPVKPPVAQFFRAWASVARVPATQSGSWVLKADRVVCAVNPVMSCHWAAVE